MTECRVPSDSVVKSFDVFKEALTSLRTSVVFFSMYEFLLQSGEEAFHRRIVSAGFHDPIVLALKLANTSVDLARMLQLMATPG